MMKRRFFLLYFALVSPAFAEAGFTKQDLSAVKSTVNEEVNQYLSNIYGVEKRDNDISVTISNLDSRLRLPMCEQPLDANIKENSYSAQNVSVKVQCKGVRRWTIYVPVSIDIYAEVAVSTRNLHRGDTISQGDFILKRTNTSMISQNYIDNAKGLLGMQLHRPLRSGSVIKNQDIKKPNLIDKGDTVIVIASNGTLEVKSEATALSNGIMGQQIKVRNDKSKRIVDARVSGRGIAEIAL